MKIEYNDYTNDVTATRQLEGLWSAKVLIWPIVETTKASRVHHEIEGYKSQGETEEAGLQLGRKRLNLYAKIKLLLRIVTRTES